MKLGYARVSTDEQTLALQLDALQAAGCTRIFRDNCTSGAVVERPGLTQALAAIGPGDALVVWKLDRLGRSLHHLIEIMNDLNTRGAGFQSLSESIDTTTAGGKLVFHIMGALAEFERALIAERTKAGMEAAKRRGVRIGRPPSLSARQVQAVLRRKAKGETLEEIADEFDVSVRTLRRALRTATIEA